MYSDLAYQCFGGNIYFIESFTLRTGLRLVGHKQRGKLMFNRKNTATHLIFHTSGSSQKRDLFSPQEGMKLLPDWFKTINKSQHSPTLTTCPGFIDLFKKSINIPLWSDINITYKDNEITDVQMPGIGQITRDFVQIHSSEQWGEGFKNSLHIKLMSPWHITSNIDTPFLMHDAVWHKENINDYNVLSGVIEFKYQHASHINIMLPKNKQEKTLKLKAGTIIAHLTPLVDTKLSIESKLVLHEEWLGLTNYISSFKTPYAIAKKIGEK